jgi:outer membrane receptor for ferrienterochelin and colicin
VSGYYSWYKNFIGYKIGVDVDTFSYTVPIFFPPYSQTIRDLRFNNVVRVATNSEDKVTTQGFTAGLNYYLGKYFALITNYSYNVLDRHGSTDPLIPAYNTPKHKFNIGFNGRDIKGIGFNINYKWIDGFYYEGSPQFTGPIKTYALMDAQVNYKFGGNHVTLKFGSSNLLNNLHYEIYGGPLVGRMFYLSLLFEFAQ